MADQYALKREVEWAFLSQLDMATSEMQNVSNFGPLQSIVSNNGATIH